MQWIPEEFFHGFLALKDNTKFYCKTTGHYNKESECYLDWKSSSPNIEWPNLANISVNEKD
ncbi:dTDP-4-dehydrorhamnose 3,5-epimerase family protein [Alishewanella tabrizica]|uniref:dTDP-4-dehydrorhamnose 3,5-epimerase n=1 Tax=Alishewanella tabrizica TaxID=671278 RepID=A0ABQ2WMH1_9ALTE|nr:hypothetical protein GCM10008111_13550 [Alishewanella tabrizica]